jgi:hypothetical protein
MDMTETVARICADGEPTGNGRKTVYYDKRGRLVAVEITNITTL